MGEEVAPATKSPSTSLKNYFDSLCAYCLSIGVSYETFWDENPSLITYYIEAEKIRQRRRNNELWLMGAYVYNAVGSLSPLLNALSKNHKAEPYLKEPIPLTEEEVEERRAKRAQAFKNKLYKLSKNKTEDDNG